MIDIKLEYEKYRKLVEATLDSLPPNVTSVSVGHHKQWTLDLLNNIEKIISLCGRQVWDGVN